ncbi:MAG: hypothetical protein K2Y21_01545 [Phycisphaerales bacterium]|nr:hypothetical protein [Phycisphaerales bacterium]
MGIDPIRTPLLALAALATTSLASAQTFQAYYSSDTVFGNDLVNSRDCGFVAVGNARYGTFAISTAFLMRLTPEGKVDWSRRYFNPPGLNSAGHALVESSQNNDLIVAGNVGVQLLNTQERLVMRTDSSGSPLWAVALGGGQSIQPLGNTAIPGFVPVGVTEMHKGQIASVARRLNSNGAARVALLSMLDADGSLLFSNRYVPPGGSGISLDFIQARETRDPDPSSELLVLGSLTISTNFVGLFAMRTDIDGNIIWSKVYRLGDGVTSMLGCGFDLASNGDILFSANRIVLPAPIGAIPATIVGRIDSLTGDPVWSVAVDAFGTGYQSVTRTPDDGVIVAGLVGSNHNTATAALRVDGTTHDAKVWQYANVVAGSDALADAVVPVNPWGGYALLGRSREFSFNDNVVMIRTNNDMLTRCDERELNASFSATEIRGNNAPLQIVADPTYLPITMESDDPKFERNTQCLFTRCLGDLNADGFVDDSDFVLFATAYNTLICPTDPAITCCPADLNNDTFVDDADFVLFADAYNALLCP